MCHSGISLYNCLFNIFVDSVFHQVEMGKEEIVNKGDTGHVSEHVLESEDAGIGEGKE